MAISTDRCVALANQFCELYPAAEQVIFRVAPTAEDIYGDQGRNLQFEGAEGGFLPATRSSPTAYCDIYASRVRDEDALVRLLRHELLGHFGINTLSPQDKQYVLSGIIKSQHDPELAILWGMVNKHYADSPLLLRAEEIFAFASEAIQPWQLQFASASQRAFEASCKQQIRPMSIKDLQSVAIMVADRMCDPELSIRTVPLTRHHQFDRDNVTCEGVFVGKVISAGEGWVEQRINREGDSVHHIEQLLSAKPKVGDLVDIRYQSGLGAVRGLDRSLELAR